MHEIVHVQVGHGTNIIRNAFCLTMGVEHKLAKNGKFAANKDDPDNQRRLDKIDVYCKKVGELRFVPHAALIDSKVDSSDVIKASPISTMVKLDNFVFSASSAGNNWAVDGVVNVIRKSSQGFPITYSLGEGTGSGLAGLLFMKIGNNYPYRITAIVGVYVSDFVVEPYNATLSTHQFLEIDNEALYNISHDILKQQASKYGELNWTISLVMNSGIVASLRFSGKLNGA